MIGQVVAQSTHSNSARASTILMASSFISGGIEDAIDHYLNLGPGTLTYCPVNRHALACLGHKFCHDDFHFRDASCLHGAFIRGQPARKSHFIRREKSLSWMDCHSGAKLMELINFGGEHLSMEYRS